MTFSITRPRTQNPKLQYSLAVPGVVFSGRLSSIQSITALWLAWPANIGSPPSLVNPLVCWSRWRTVIFLTSAE